MTTGQRGSTDKQRLARSHNWKMYRISGNRNTLRFIISDLERSETVTEETIEIAREIEASYQRLLYSMNTRRI